MATSAPTDTSVTGAPAPRFESRSLENEERAQQFWAARIVGPFRNQVRLKQLGDSYTVAMDLPVPIEEMFNIQDLLADEAVMHVGKTGVNGTPPKVYIKEFLGGRLVVQNVKDMRDLKYLLLKHARQDA